MVEGKSMAVCEIDFLSGSNEHRRMIRCPWLPVDKPLYVEYHDTEWGSPSRDERYLFEMICLEGAQAGLSWWTVLQKRARYREVFRNFVPEEVAKMTDRQLERLLDDPGIIRHRGKVFSVRQNARAWQELNKQESDMAGWVWSFVDGKTIIRRPKSMSDYKATSTESDALSKALRKAGFNFVGSTTIYAFMQAVGMIDEHSKDCYLA